MCISSFRNSRPAPAATSKAPPIDVSALLNASTLKHHFPIPEVSSSSSSSSTSSASSSHGSQHTHIIVQHNYHDHANDKRSDYREDKPARGGVRTPFPLRLHEMLATMDADGLAHVISWQPHGRCFVIHKPQEFAAVLPKYFKLSKLASFQRQLNLYGFQRLTRGRDKGGYYNELFLRQRVFLAHSIQRVKVKGTGVRARSNPDQEPDLWNMPWVQEKSSSDERNDEAVLDSALLNKVIGELPLHLTLPVSESIQSELPTPPASTEASDVVCDAFEKTFHYLDPFQPTSNPSQEWTVSGVDELLSSEADSFFEDFDFPENIEAGIEDDDVFGDMLEQMIA